MEVEITYPSQTVQYVINTMQLFHEQQRFPEVSPSNLFECLEFVLFIGFDDFLKYLVPQITQNLYKIPDKTLRMFPLFLRAMVVNQIPISNFNPDFIIEHFGFDFLANRVEHSYSPKMNNIPFRIMTQYPELDIKSLVANTLAMYNPSNFINYNFVRSNCTSLEMKTSFFNIKPFINLKELIIKSAEINSSLGEFLLPSLERLEISQTKLDPSHFQEIIEFVSANANLKTLSLRETKMGSVGCTLFMNAIQNGKIKNLKNLDIGQNGIGATAIIPLLKAIPDSSIETLSIDANFFNASSESIFKLYETPLKAISLRGIHWDGESALKMQKVLEINKNVKFWDLSAQIVHQHSDPDLSPQMAQLILEKSQPDIDALFFSNHNLQHMNLSCILHIKLKALTITNSNLMDDSVEALIPMLVHLSFLDLSYNSITFRGSTFLSACVKSPSLKYLFLSDNEIGDSGGKILFDEMKEYGTNISTLRLRNCFLRHRASASLLNLLAKGDVSFDELDIGGNDMFHLVHNFETELIKRSRIETFFVGANNVKKMSFGQVFDVIKDMKFVDLDRMSCGSICNIAKKLNGVVGLSICFARIQSIDDLILILKESGASELWIINSIPQKVLNGLMKEHAKIPKLMAIHIGTDLIVPVSPPIPVFVEGNI